MPLSRPAPVVSVARLPQTARYGVLVAHLGRSELHKSFSSLEDAVGFGRHLAGALRWTFLEPTDLLEVARADVERALEMA
jgi:hypothetical protein